MRDIYGFIAEGKKAERSASSGICDVRRRLPRQLHRRSDSREREAGQRVDEGELLMATQAFDPKFMKVGVLTAALQELTPREVRDPDPDRAIEEWVEFARELGADYIQLSAALHPTETDVPPEAMLDPVANTLDLRKPFDKERAARVKRRTAGEQDRPLGCRLLRQHAAPRSGGPAEEARVHAAGVRRGGAARRRRRLRLRRPQPAAHDGREPDRLRGVVHSAAEGGEGARADLPRRAVPDAGLDDGRQLAQQHRLHARHLDRAASNLREARRRRSTSASTTTRRTRS